MSTECKFVKSVSGKHEFFLSTFCIYFFISLPDTIHVSGFKSCVQRYLLFHMYMQRPGRETPLNANRLNLANCYASVLLVPKL